MNKEIKTPSVRNLPLVVEVLIKKIPKDFDKGEVLSKEMKQIAKDYSNLNDMDALTLYFHRFSLWTTLFGTISAIIPEPELSWQKDFVNIASGQKDYTREIYQ